MKKIFLGIILLFYINTAQSQIFGKILKEVTKDVTDHIVEKATEEIANKIARNINKKFDEALASSYDSTQQVKYPTYDGYLTAMNSKANIPKEFNFDLFMDIETKADNETSEIRMYLSKNSKVVGMETVEEGNTSLIIMDIDNDVMIVYSTDKNGNKTAQAMPSFSKLAKLGLQMSANEAEQDNESFFEKTGRTKTIAGYTCDEYKGGTKDGTYKAYFANDFPVKWEETYFGYWGQYISDDQKKKFPAGKNLGMMMRMKTKDNDGNKSKWEVIFIKNESTKIVNSEYKF